MKSSSILQAVLHKFKHDYDKNVPGICDNVRLVIRGNLWQSFGSGMQQQYYNAMDFVEAYRPMDYGYWWPENDVETRIKVLEWAIRDALEQGD